MQINKPPLISKFLTLLLITGIIMTSVTATRAQGSDLDQQTLEALASRLGVSTDRLYLQQIGSGPSAYYSVLAFDDGISDHSYEVQIHRGKDVYGEYSGDSVLNNFFSTYENGYNISPQTFHGLPAFTASYTEDNYREYHFLWSSGPWMFHIIYRAYTNQETALPSPEDVAEILYEITEALGMVYPPQTDDQPPESTGLAAVPSSGDNAGNQTITLPGDTTTIAAGALIGAVIGMVLIALISGSPPFQPGNRFGPQINLKGPSGKVRSPIQGGSFVDPHVAKYQQDLLDQGYVYDPTSRTFKLPKVSSPLDGTPVSASQAAWERAQLARGLVYDPASNSFVEPGAQTRREQNWQHFSSQEASQRRHEKIQLELDRQKANDPAYQANLRKLEASRQRLLADKREDLAFQERMSQYENNRAWAMDVVGDTLEAVQLANNLAAVAVTPYAVAAGAVFVAKALQASPFVFSAIQSISKAVTNDWGIEQFTNDLIYEETKNAVGYLLGKATGLFVKGPLHESLTGIATEGVYQIGHKYTVQNYSAYDPIRYIAPRVQSSGIPQNRLRQLPNQSVNNLGNTALR